MNRLLSAPDTIVLLSDPFSSDDDAKSAESVAIRVAMTGGRIQWLNDRERARSSRIHPLLPTRPGVLPYLDLQRTAIAVINADVIDDERGCVLATTPAAAIVERVLRWWPTGAAIRDGYPVARFVAVSKAGGVLPSRVVGDWDTLPAAEWADDGTIGVRDPTARDPRGTVGMTFDWCGAHPGNQLTWSPDIRESKAP